MDSAYVICNQTLFAMYQAEATKPHPSARLVMSIYKNDVIILGGKYIRIVGLDPTNTRIVIGENHIVSTPENKKLCGFNRFITEQPKKLYINAIGQVKLGENKY